MLSYYQQHKEHLRKLQRERRRRMRIPDYCTHRAKFSHLRRGAIRLQKRGISSTLTFDQYIKLIAPGICFYCEGSLPKSGAGIDRKNSSLGYTLDNCVACCTTCNSMRGHDNILPHEMFYVLDLLKRLRERSDETDEVR